jgi:hypothetical protein
LGDSEANTHAMVDGITTVRVICHSLAPNPERQTMIGASAMRGMDSRL